MKLNFHPHYAFRVHLTFLLLGFQSFWEQICSLYWKLTSVYVTGLLTEPIRYPDSTGNCVGKVHWFWIFQQVALCFETIKWDWTNLAKDRTTFCISIIHYENLGRKTCNCRKEESVMRVWITVQQEWEKYTQNETNMEQDR